MSELILSGLESSVGDVEVVERKGLGHPDSICDALAETFTRNLCREYLKSFGSILHHNVDKALLIGGRAKPTFGGGDVLAPIEIILAGRALNQIGERRVPVEEIAVEGSRTWLKENLHALDSERDVRLSCRVSPGSQDLQGLFSRNENETVPLANDTSIGVGYAPLSALERLVLDLEQSINRRDRLASHPAWGEDVKVMAVRRGKRLRLTIACAMIGRYLYNLDAYMAERDALHVLAQERSLAHGFAETAFSINAADHPHSGEVYLTVTGTSAEAGDDGEVGRGNRGNGLITPCRPMSLEAIAGKNPRTHVGKIYNVLANKIANAVVEQIADIKQCHCLLVSEIGKPIDGPSLIQLSIDAPGHRSVVFRKELQEIVDENLAAIASLTVALAAGNVPVY